MKVLKFYRFTCCCNIDIEPTLATNDNLGNCMIDQELVTEIEDSNNDGLKLSQKPQTQINYEFSYLRRYFKIFNGTKLLETLKYYF